jgi:hypothetical protein
MAEINITGNMKVGTLRKQFMEAFGATLRVYKGQGNQFADDTSTLASIRQQTDKKAGELAIKGNMLVGNFETKFETIFGIKVQVASPDNSVLSANTLTLTAAGKEQPKVTKAPERAKALTDAAEFKADKGAEEKSGPREYLFQKERLTMGRLVNAVLKAYVAKNAGITYDKLKHAFPDGILKSYGVFTLKEKAIQMYKEKNKKFYYIEKEELIKLSDTTIATSTQWTKEEFPKFLEAAKALKIIIEEA